MDKFEEYKLLSERAQKLSERRQQTSQIYLTVNTAIFGGIAFLLKDSGLHNQLLLWGLLPICIVGILICVIWLNIIIRLEKVLAWQYNHLRKMESNLPGSERLFSKENEALYREGSKHRKFSFSLLEAWLPSLLMVVYILSLIGVYIAIHSGNL
jgi:hypothetical protein